MNRSIVLLASTALCVGAIPVCAQMTVLIPFHGPASSGGTGTLSLAIGPVGGPYTAVPMQMDEVGTYSFNGEPTANGIRTVNFSTRVPSVPGSGGTFQVQISYNGVPVATRTEQNSAGSATNVPFTFGAAFQRGTIPSVSYTPGTGLPYSTGGHDIKVIFGTAAIPVRDGNGATIGSGVWVCDANQDAALGHYTKSGGYRITSNGALMTSYAVDGPCVDQANGSPTAAQLWAHFPSIQLWQTAPNSGVLGEVRVEDPWITNGPWLNVATNATAVYTGDMALYDGSTLIAQRSTGLGSSEGGPFSIQPSAVTTGINGTCGAGTISTNFQLPAHTVQDGEPVLYNGPATGGTAIGGMTPGRVYWYGSSLAGTGTGNLVLSPASQNGGGNPLTCPNITSQGVGAQNFTPVSSINYRAVTMIGPDEIGSPLWLAAANPAPTVHLNPALTTAEQSYLEVAGVVPPYYLNVALPPLVLGGNVGGPAYRPNSTGYEDVPYGAGGDHLNLGPLGEWAARALLDEKSVSWDDVRETAMSMMSVPAVFVMNEATGYMPALNSKTYATLGTSLPNDFWDYPTNGTQTGMEIPPTATGNTSSAYLGGMVGTGVDGQHWADWGPYILALLTGDRSMLDEQYFSANAQLMNSSVNTFGIGSRNFTMAGQNYTARITFQQSMRRSAWLMREVMHASILGSDSNPEKQYLNDVLDGDVDNFYTVTHNYADPGMAALGVTEMQSDYQANFMADYEATSYCALKGLIRYTSPVTGGSTAAECDYMTRWPVTMLATNWPTYWAFTEQVTDTDPSAFFAAPAQLPHASGPSQIFTHGNAGFLSEDATGLFTINGALFPQMETGDAALIWDQNPNNDFGPTTKYYLYSVTQPAETFRLSTTCTAATTLNPCPSPAITPFVPAHGPYAAGTNFSLAFQFQYNPPGVAANGTGGNGSSDYVVWARSSLAIALDNGGTTPGLATAFANADARFVYPTRWDDADRWAIDPTVRVH